MRSGSSALVASGQHFLLGAFDRAGVAWAVRVRPSLFEAALAAGIRWAAGLMFRQAVLVFVFVGWHLVASGGALHKTHLFIFISVFYSQG